MSQNIQLKFQIQLVQLNRDNNRLLSGLKYKAKRLLTLVESAITKTKYKDGGK